MIKITFLGIGLMGHPMASHLAQAGYPLTVWNRTLAKAAPLAAKGAKVEADLMTAVAQADVVISMLEAGPVVADIASRARPALRAATLWVDMSSTQPREARAIAAALTEAKVSFIDAPVSGGVNGAEAGSLAIMAGASVDDFARVEAILATMGRPTRVGPVGSGQVAKLCNQLIVGGTLNIIAEALLLAEAAGADPAAVRQAIRGGFAESRLLEVHGQRMLDRNFVPGGQIKSQLKDLRNVLQAAAEAGVELPVAALVTAHYGLLEACYPQADQSAALLAVEQLNPGHRLGAKPDQLP
jgi:2-hydroxy-3-oxopropionate reductase